MVIEDSSERAADMMVKLIQSMYSINLITLDQLTQVSHVTWWSADSGKSCDMVTS